MMPRLQRDLLAAKKMSIPAPSLAIATQRLVPPQSPDPTTSIKGRVSEELTADLWTCMPRIQSCLFVSPVQP